MDTLKQLSLAGLIPVIKIQDAADAVPLCKALCDGGLPVAEITFRTEAAEESIRLVHESLPGMLLGAGTVLTSKQADRAWTAGAGYIVSPGLNPEVVRHCVDFGYPILPGCANPSDIETALSFNIKTVKFFPAEALGGLPLIKAMSAPYGDVSFVPTGGISEKNLTAYLSFPKVAACGGSWMVPEDAVAQKDWARITRLASEAVRLMLSFELRHIGINNANEEKARIEAKKLSALMGMPITEHTGSVFVGDGFEMMKRNYLGANGHIAVSTPNVERAQWYLERRGFSFSDSTAGYQSNGRLKSIYLADEIGGFAIHLVAK